MSTDPEERFTPRSSEWYQQYKAEGFDFDALAQELHELPTLVANRPINEPQEDLSGAPSPRQCIETNIIDFVAESFPPRQHLIGPFVRQGLAMVFAPAGVGKTHFCMGIGFALATGGEFLKWKAEAPGSVLYIDGELPAYTLQERLRELMRGYEGPTPTFSVITPDKEPDGAMPDLATEAGQLQVKGAIDRADLIIIDNLSTLVRTGEENEAKSWVPVQEWALQLRKRGKSIIFVHHAGKGPSASQRGTSKRIDVLDVVVELKSPNDHEAHDGCVFEVSFPKNRNYRVDRPNDAKKFVATLVSTEFAPSFWTFKDSDLQDFDKIKELVGLGLSQKEIVEELDSTKQKVSAAVHKMGLTPVKSKPGRRKDLDNDQDRSF